MEKDNGGSRGWLFTAVSHQGALLGIIVPLATANPPRFLLLVRLPCFGAS